MNHDNDRSAAQIQDDVKHSRSQLDQTLSQIEQRLAPGRLMEDGLDYLRHNGATEYVANLGDAAKRDPVPLALVGVGIAWLMLSSRRGASNGSTGLSTNALSRGIGSTVTGVKDAGSSVKGTVSDLGDKLSQTKRSLSETAQSAMDRTREIGDAARQGAERVRGSYDYLVNEQPLALGAIGLALGVAIAAAAPRTRQEDRLMGDASDRIGDDVKAAGREQLDKVKHAAASAEDAARESLGTGSTSAAPTPSPTPTPTPNPSSPKLPSPGAP